MSDLRKIFGALLKEEREKRQVSLADLAEQLKISEEYLEGIETGDASNLPSELYYRLFAKSYSDAVGIDFAETMRRLEAEHGQNGIATTPNGKPQTPPLSPKDKAREPDADEVAEEEQEAEPVQISSLKKWLYAFVGLVIVFGAFLIVNELFLSGSVLTFRSGSDTSERQENAASGQADRVQSAVAAYDWNVPQYHPPGKIRLTLTPRQESWSTILADGDTVLFRNLIPGRVYEREAEYRMLVSVGIPSVVDVKLNGKPVDLRDSETRRISRVEINQMNLDVFLNPPPPPEIDSSAVETQTAPVGARPDESATMEKAGNEL